MTGSIPIVPPGVATRIVPAFLFRARRFAAATVSRSTMLSICSCLPMVFMVMVPLLLVPMVGFWLDWRLICPATLQRMGLPAALIAYPHPYGGLARHRASQRVLVLFLCRRLD